MKRCPNSFSRVLVVGILLPLMGFAQEDRSYADELFRKADYYHAFFIYRNLFGGTISENQFALRCTQAMTLTKQYSDYRAINRYYEAKSKLRELLVINPEDFHYPDLPQMSIEEATYWHKLALKQGSAMETNLMLEKAIALYKEGQNDGWKTEDANDAIRQCKIAKAEGIVNDKIPTMKLSSEVTKGPFEGNNKNSSESLEHINQNKISSEKAELNAVSNNGVVEKSLPSDMKLLKPRLAEPTNNPLQRGDLSVISTKK